jgi:hypothetical protein
MPVVKELIISVGLIATVMALATSAQKTGKPWQEWSKKEAESILNDSPWGQTQIETDTSEMFFRPQLDPGFNPSATNANRDRQGATNQATRVKYRIRFLSAKPIRQAVARLIKLEQANYNSTVEAYMNDFVDRQFDQWIAVAVTFEADDQRFSGEALQAFASSTAGSLKNSTYLERKDGKRLFLDLYQAPQADGLGAKFIFKRLVEGKPFLNNDSGEVRFVSELSNTLKLDMRFKVGKMMYDGKLEY